MMLPQTIRAIVVDDEPLARERIRMFAERTGNIEVIAECGSGRAAVEMIRSERPDLVFLDIQMPGLDGFGVVREIGADQMPPVVFVTAYDRHAVRAFEVHALDYLLKPFRPERFFEAVGRVTRIIQEGKRESVDALSGLIADRTSCSERILVKGARRAVLVPVADIEWIQAAGNYVRLHTHKKEHLIRQTMNRMAKQLDPDRFVRIHRSAIVNVGKIKELGRNAAGGFEITLLCGKRLRLSRGYRQNLDRFDPLAADFAR